MKLSPTAREYLDSIACLAAIVGSIASFFVAMDVIR